VSRGSKGGWIGLGTLVIGGGIIAGIAIFLNRFKTAAYELAPGVFQRDPSEILFAVQVVDPGHNPELQPGAVPAPVGGTWCNKALYLMLRQLGINLPWGDYGTRANDLIAWIDASNDGWYPISESDAQAAALNGTVVVATFYNFGSEGHLALVLPISAPEIQIAQAGRHTFNQGNLSDGFGRIRPNFFAHA
jgi:hypothetical protein